MITRRLRVASYNVHSFVGTDSQRSVFRVAAVIAALEADIVGLQEVDIADGEEDAEHRLRALLRPVPHVHVAYAAVRPSGFGSFGNAVLSRYPIMGRHVVDLSFPHRERRAALELEIDVGWACPLRVVATHLGLGPHERRTQVQQLLNHLRSEQDVPTVLLGDFNEWFLYGRPLRRIHARFGRGPAAATFPSRFPVFALDRIWVHPATALRGCRAFSSPTARIASDHLPIMAEIEPP